MNTVHYTAGLHAAVLSFTRLYAEMEMNHASVGSACMVLIMSAVCFIDYLS